MATVALLVPWRPGDAHREAAWHQLRTRHLEHGRTVVEGTSPDGPWCKAAAVADALAHTDADLLVIHDADVWCDELDQAVAALDRDTRWAVPHLKVHRLAEGQHEPTDDRRRLAQMPYKGYLGGGIVAIDRHAYEACPLDDRFLGWGQEDEAWATALSTLYGQPWRGVAPLWHWWHPPQERRSRGKGNPASVQLHRRYKRASTDRRQMLALLEEVRACPSPTSSSTTRASTSS